MKKLFFIIALALLAFGIYKMQAQAYPPQRNRDYCSLQVAFRNGLDDGRRKMPMMQRYARACPPKFRQALNRAYRSGYQQGSGRSPARRRPQPYTKKMCVKTAFGKRACGFGCVTAFNRVRCAPKPGQHCEANNFGHVSCGYACMKSPTSVKCTQNRGDNCVKDFIGRVHCGKNCRVHGFKVRCG